MLNINGICGNIYDQLRLNTGKELYFNSDEFLQLMNITNKDDCLKTRKINFKLIDSLRNNFVCSYNFDCIERNFSQFPNKIKFLKMFVKDFEIKNVLQIGFGAGHSTEILLKYDDEINVTSIDVGEYCYIDLCNYYIHQKYGNRHKLIIGNSNNILEKHDNKYDLIIMDGSNDDEIIYK
jgi:predicted O-methyltransferase YrrM